MLAVHFSCCLRRHPLVLLSLSVSTVHLDVTGFRQCLQPPGQASHEGLSARAVVRLDVTEDRQGSQSFRQYRGQDEGIPCDAVPVVRLDVAEIVRLLLSQDAATASL